MHKKYCVLLGELTITTKPMTLFLIALPTTAGVIKLCRLLFLPITQWRISGVEYSNIKLNALAHQQ
ncbi:hypothetical protein GCM10007916_29130 [Psychromonas marina]|uniref:Uncharacterized protein n=1 Tax=Psychromonas marina TaxID=88364 RepID=A0ABQ6E3T6_9GAMM|nr:hypothetical protein GCM10007916_29130 [Psychromonas marina]